MNRAGENFITIPLPADADFGKIRRQPDATDRRFTIRSVQVRFQTGTKVNDEFQAPQTKLGEISVKPGKTGL